MKKLTERVRFLGYMKGKTKINIKPRYMYILLGLTLAWVIFMFYLYADTTNRMLIAQQATIKYYERVLGVVK